VLTCVMDTLPLVAFNVTIWAKLCHRVAFTHHSKTMTFVGALTLRGFIAPFVLDGPINRGTFET
jgi:hypothetical protein